MLEKLRWKTLIFELFLVLITGFILGSLFSQPAVGVITALLLLIFWHYWQLMRLSRWLWVDRSLIPPKGRGSWEPLFYGLHLVYNRNKRRRRELRGLIQRFRSGAESLPDALILITDEGTIFWCNNLAQQNLGLRWPEDSGQNIINLLRYPEFTRYLQQRDFSKPLTLQLNNEHQFEFRLMPYSDTQWLMAARDVTQLQQLESIRRNFFANVSHELRTPLTVLQGYLEMLEQPELADNQRLKALHTMQGQTRRMESLIRQLLQLSRIEAALPVEMQDIINVPAMLSLLKNEVETLSAGAHQLNFTIDPQLQVKGNYEQLHSAIANLIYNAIRHTEPGTSILISWQRTPQGANFRVCDNGAGISAEHLPHLTERFYRVDKSRSSQTGGSGLGLSIVKHALMHHHSRLQISSIPGTETCFSFVLPKSMIC